MEKRWFAAIGIILVSIVALFVLLGLMASTTTAVANPALAAPLKVTVPIVTGIAPDSAPNDINTPIVIIGTGFTTGATATLNTTRLTDVSWVSSTTLTASVPWGLDAGIYTLTVTNPDGGMGFLPNAFTLTQGINTWTTGGPYGGEIWDLLVNPLTPTTAYAAVSNAGIFATEDAADHWQPRLVDNYPLRVSIDPHDPRVLYVGGHNDFYRTLDGGHTWESITPPGGCVQFCSPVAHPTQSSVVYVGAGANPWPPQPGEEGGIYRSDDYGSHWVTRTVGLTDTDVTAMAFYPDDSDHLVAGTRSGNVFVTANGGLSWMWASRVGTHIERLYVNPFGAHEVWVVSQMPFWPRTPPFLYRSLDTGLTAWTPITLPQADAEVYSLAFHPTVSGTLWAAAGNGYRSTDGGATWTELIGGLPGGARVFAVDLSVSPTLLYAGTGQGIFKSQDDGAHWTEANNGLAGVIPHALAVVPTDPDEVYAATQVLGLLKSNNGGHSWQALGTWRNGFPWEGTPLAVDPFTPTRIYLGEQCVGSLCLRVSKDGGQSWRPITATLPLTWSNWNGEVFAVAPHPRIPGRVLMGATFYPPGFDWSTPSRPAGGIYVSDDAGEHFAYRPTAPISGVVQFAYDAVDPNLVYAATEGTGLWRSTNGGDTWQPAASWGRTGYLWSVTADPWKPNTVWIGKWRDEVQPGPSSVFSSTDAGQSWMPVLWPRANDRGIRTLLFAPTVPSALYIGTEGGGLYRTRDGGRSWELLPGVPSDGTFQALATGSDGERVAVYVGTSGGTATAGAASTASTVAQTDSTVLGAGVYRSIARLPHQRVYLPLIVRASAP